MVLHRGAGGDAAGELLGEEGSVLGVVAVDEVVVDGCEVADDDVVEVAVVDAGIGAVGVGLHGGDGGGQVVERRGDLGDLVAADTL